MYRKNIKKLTDIPNVGKAIENDFIRIGIKTPDDLTGKDPYEMYYMLCDATSSKHDPCVIDIFISAVRFMEGGPPKKWWKYTAERKKRLSER